MPLISARKTSLFVGPQGPQGIPGPRGDPGPTGPSGSQGNPGIGAGWVQLFDLDFTVQPNQTLGADGSHTIAGMTFVKFGSADETPGPSTSTQIIGGTGLVWQPAINGITLGQYYGNAPYHIPPILRLQLSSLITGFDATTPLRVWMTVNSNSAGADNTSGPFMGFDNGSYASSFPHLITAFVRAGFDQSAYKILPDMWWNTSNGIHITGGPDFDFGNTGSSLTNLKAWQTLMMDMPEGVAGAEMRTFISQLATGSGFPTPAQMIPMGDLRGSTTGNAPTLNVIMDWALVLGCAHGTGGGGASISRVRVDYKAG